MSATILTLFGEEVVPEQVKAVGKPRTVPVKEKKKKETEKAADETATDSEEVEVIAADGIAVTSEILKDWSPEKQYYTIGEVAGLFDVRTSHIRFWTKEFNLKVRTTKKGDRLYTPEQILQLKTIYHLLKERRFTIKGAKAKLKEYRKPSVMATTTDLKQSLLHLRGQLQIIRDGLA